MAACPQGDALIIIISQAEVVVAPHKFRAGSAFWEFNSVASPSR